MGADGRPHDCGRALVWRAGHDDAAGGQYVYLREAFHPLCGFLYGWTLFLVIQTGTVAAVSVGFARYVGALWPAIADDHNLISPIHLSAGYALSLSTTHVVALVLIAVLTWTNTRGLEYGKAIQNVFTTAEIGALVGLVGIGALAGWNAEAVGANFGDLWGARGTTDVVPGVNAITAFGLFVALCVSQTGSLFSADAWNNITFTAGEVKDPQRHVPLSRAFGTIVVIGLAGLRQSVQQPARLHRVGGARLLHPDDCGGVPLAQNASRCTTAVSRVRLSRRPGPLHRRRSGEAKTLAALNHPHIAAIYGLEESAAAGRRTALLIRTRADPGDPPGRRRWW